MNTITLPSRTVPVIRQSDVLVVGGGPAGMVAAIAAARQDVSVVLVERYGALGGLACGGLVLYMDGLHDGDGNRCVDGIPWELLQRLDEMGGLATEAPLRLHVDSELFQVAADDLCLAGGVELRFHSLASQTITKRGQVAGIVVETKAGPQALLARVVIDATGDGDVAAQAGASFQVGYQRIGLNLKLGGVDEERFAGFRHDDPDTLKALIERLRALGGFPLSIGPTPYLDQEVCWVNVLGLATRSDTQPAPGLDPFAGQLSALQVEDLSYAQVELRRRALLSLQFYNDHIPGFEHAMLLAFAPQLGVRDSRRITGLYQLNGQEMRSGARYEDTVGVAGLTFGARGTFDLPYRCLVPKGVNGLLVAGRCISADDWAQQRARLIPAAMVSGQAAGTAAALACRMRVTPASLDVHELRRQLEYDGVHL